jgi:hypothetical protein
MGLPVCAETGFPLGCEGSNGCAWLLLVCGVMVARVLVELVCAVAALVLAALVCAGAAEEFEVVLVLGKADVSV